MQSNREILARLQQDLNTLVGEQHSITDTDFNAVNNTALENLRGMVTRIQRTLDTETQDRDKDQKKQIYDVTFSVLLQTLIDELKSYNNGKLTVTVQVGGFMGFGKSSLKKTSPLLARIAQLIFSIEDHVIAVERRKADLALQETRAEQQRQAQQSQALQDQMTSFIKQQEEAARKREEEKATRKIEKEKAAEEERKRQEARRAEEEAERRALTTKVGDLERKIEDKDLQLVAVTSERQAAIVQLEAKNSELVAVGEQMQKTLALLQSYETMFNNMPDQVQSVLRSAKKFTMETTADGGFKLTADHTSEATYTQDAKHKYISDITPSKENIQGNKFVGAKAVFSAIMSPRRAASAAYLYLYFLKLNREVIDGKPSRNAEKYIHEKENIDQKGIDIKKCIGTCIFYFMMEPLKPWRQLLQGYELCTLTDSTSLEKGKLYLKKTAEGLEYAALGPDNQPKSGKLSKTEFPFPSKDPFRPDDLLPLLPKLLEILSKKGHTEKPNPFMSLFVLGSQHKLPMLLRQLEKITGIKAAKYSLENLNDKFINREPGKGPLRFIGKFAQQFFYYNADLQSNEFKLYCKELYDRDLQEHTSKLSSLYQL